MTGRETAMQRMAADALWQHDNDINRAARALRITPRALRERERRRCQATGADYIGRRKQRTKRRYFQHIDDDS
jgi:hypothetical protein